MWYAFRMRKSGFISCIFVLSSIGQHLIHSKSISSQIQAIESSTCICQFCTKKKKENNPKSNSWTEYLPYKRRAVKNTHMKKKPKEFLKGLYIQLDHHPWAFSRDSQRANERNRMVGLMVVWSFGRLVVLGKVERRNENASYPVIHINIGRQIDLMCIHIRMIYYIGGRSLKKK